METIWEIVKPILISLLTAIITVKLSLRKFRTEKWWEKKAETYAKIIDALHHLKNYCEKKLDVEYGCFKLDQKVEEKLAEQYKMALSEVSKAIDVGAFILTDEAVEILETYQNRPELSWDDYPLFEIIEHDLKYTKECLQTFKIVAKKDLGIH